PPAALRIWARYAGLPNGAAVERGPVHLPSSAYFGHVDPDGLTIWVDAGAPSPPHQPGHAHNGILGFVLDLGGIPFIVDRGVHGYDDSPFRTYCRSTHAHSTVTIDGGEQNECWGTFRVGRRARVLRAAAREAPGGGWQFTSACRPYGDRERLHIRRFRLEGSRLLISDRVLGCTGAPYVSYLQLHPSVNIEFEAEGILVRRGSTSLRIVPVGFDSWRIAAGEQQPQLGWHFPDFGTAVPAPTLAGAGTAGRSRSGFVIEALS
ncbi:MAG: heparinase II/III family protein, partial [Longimicrobiales bacterium]